MAASDIPCGQCLYSDVHKLAHKWCFSCQEGFCKDCEEMHKNINSLENHKLIGIEDYVKLSNIYAQSSCEVHEEMSDSYCKTHDAPICLSCALSKHKSCSDIIPLEHAAINAKSSTAFIDLQETISLALKNIQSIIRNTNPENIDQEEKKVIESIREVRTNVNHRLDEIERNLIIELNSKLTKHRSKQSEIFKHSKTLQKTIEHLNDQITELKNVASDLHIFLGTRKINREVHKCLKSTLKYNVVHNYNFNVEIDQVFISLLNDIKTFGKINVEVEEINIPLSEPKISQAQIHVHPAHKIVRETRANLKQEFRIKKKSKYMFVSGCTILSNGHVLIVDNDGKKQLMQYNQNGKHVRDIPVSDYPYDVTVIDSDRVVVSFGVSQYIEILNIVSKTVEKKLDLDSIIRGLSYQGGKICVVVAGRGIVVIELSGK